ncbi:MAG: bacterial transcriptional activator domain-containing protein [Anaerovoracaceae bacterium]
MYSGEILPGSNMDWMRSLRLYYRTLYIDMCKTAVMKLQDEGRWEDIAAVSEKAYPMEPGVEEFTVYYMQALTALGQPERTLEHSGSKKYIWKKHHQIPSGQVEQVYALAVQTIANGISEGSEIFEMLTDCSRGGHAFLCSFNVFRNIINLEMRHIERDKHTSSIVILSVFGEKTGEAEAAVLGVWKKSSLRHCVQEIL